MSDDEIRIAIAEACKPKLFVIRKPIRDPFGYYRQDACGYTGNINEAWKVDAETAAKYTTGPAYAHEPDRVIAEPAPIPDYPNDLNAMHEAEKIFDSQPIDEQSKYLDYLYCTVGWDDANDARDAKFKCQYGSVRSTARQRAEAFLRTIGKWKDQ